MKKTSGAGCGCKVPALSPAQAAGPETCTLGCLEVLKLDNSSCWDGNSPSSVQHWIFSRLNQDAAGTKLMKQAGDSDFYDLRCKQSLECICKSTFIHQFS